MTERRKVYRIKAHFFVDGNIILKDEKKNFSAVSEDLSPQGIKILCEEFLPTGNKLKLNIHLIDKIVEMEAEVVWCKKDYSLDTFSAGLNFLKAEPLFANLHTSDLFLSSSKNLEFVINSAKIKRVMDVFLSSLFLFILSPIIFITCLFIKIDSPGPILFKQWRAGRNGRKFRFYKFRSMYYNGKQIVHKEYARQLILDSYRFGWVDNRAIYKLTWDSRITKLGHVIRKLSIDEIPQLFNVLKGDMSMVGPRPPILYELEFYDEREIKRLFVKPGITGLWQVS